MARPRRLLALLIALVLAAGASLLGPSPVSAATGTITYKCTVFGFITQDIDIALETDAPTTMTVGETDDPTLTLTVVIPEDIIKLAKNYNYTHASAAGTLGVGINGTTSTLEATYPKTEIPTEGDFTVNIAIPLPRLAPSAPGTVTYTPGALNAALTIYQGADDASPDSIEASCTVKNAGTAPAIDTVNVTGVASNASSTKVSAPATTYGRSGRATVTVSSVGGKPVTGSVTLTGAGPAQKKPVTNGKAVFALDRRLFVKAYSLKAVYTSTSGIGNSQQTVRFVVAKGSVGGIGFALNAKPTSKKPGRSTVVVKAPAGLRTPTGKVTVVLKKGGTVKTVTATLAGGRKSFALPKLAKGTWSANVRYSGDGSYRSGARPFAFTVTK